jgi:hypothetical protein
VGTLWARNFRREIAPEWLWLLAWVFPVVGAGIDPATSRFSGRDAGKTIFAI